MNRFYTTKSINRRRIRNHPMSDSAQFEIDSSGWVGGARRCPSHHHDERQGELWDTVVVHCVSLPEGQFGTGAAERLFTGCLDTTEHPSFCDLEGVEVSPHFMLDRHGQVTQFVSLHKRAWHAGVSSWGGRPAVNNFSVGIELEGDVNTPYAAAQYATLVRLLSALMCANNALSISRIVGHDQIAPDRKYDPGPLFDWRGLYTQLLLEPHAR